MAMIGEEIESGPRHDRLYRGWRLRDGCRIAVVDGPFLNRELRISDGDWGRDNPATHRLAKALLEDAIATPEAAQRGLPERLSAGFARDVLASLPWQEPWILWRLDILDWAHEQLDLARV
jgi:hypothetical protein